MNLLYFLHYNHFNTNNKTQFFYREVEVLFSDECLYVLIDCPFETRSS